MEKKVKVVEKLRWRQDFNFITVYNFETDDLYKVPPIAVDIFDCADGKKSVSEIIDEVLSKNKINKTDITSDKLQNFIEYLVKSNMLVCVE